MFSRQLNISENECINTKPKLINILNEPLFIISKYLNINEINMNQTETNISPIYINIEFNNQSNEKYIKSLINPMYINLEKYDKFNTFTVFINKLMKDNNLYNNCTICNKINSKCKHHLLGKCNRTYKCSFCHCL
jgi:hypothetical protein